MQHPAGRVGPVHHRRDGKAIPHGRMVQKARVSPLREVRPKPLLLPAAPAAAGSIAATVTSKIIAWPGGMAPLGEPLLPKARDGGKVSSQRSPSRMAATASPRPLSVAAGSTGA